MRSSVMRGLASIVGSLGLLVLAVGGCDGGVAFNFYDDDPPRRYVHVNHGHVCGPQCVHYWAGDRYVVIRDHVHGSGCGHVLVSGRWIVYRSDGDTHVHVRTPPPVHPQQPVHVHTPPARVNPPPARVVSVEHVHGPSCGCVFDRRGSKWLVIGKDHVHGRGCGHVFIEGRWTIRD